SGCPGLPSEEAVANGEWTVDHERALAGLVTIDAVRRVWIGSLEITELLRRQVQQGPSSGVVSSWSASISSISSPVGEKEREKGFWFNLNAEVIVYGATEPNAGVTIGGRPIQLRPDGTF